MIPPLPRTAVVRHCAPAVCLCVAGMAAGVAIGSPTVTGNTISWPDDGWYQVQNTETYQSICEGTSNCTVDPGTYNVINHSTATRWEGIAVPSQPAVTNVTVDGNVISWPDDGWYQVQRAFDYESICSGTLTCVVEPGTYNVINHTNGKRTDGVQVFDSGVDTANAVINSNNFSAVILQAFEIYTGRAFDFRLTRFPYVTGPVLPECSNSGSISKTPEANPFSPYHYSHTTFEQCLIGQDRVDGFAYVTQQFDGHSTNFTDFTVNFSNPIGSMTLNGEYRIRCCSGFDGFYLNNLNYDFSYSDGTLVVENANVYKTDYPDNGLLGGFFNMKPPVTNGDPVRAVMYEQMSYGSGAGGSQLAYPIGQLRLTANDGSEVRLNARSGVAGMVDVTLITTSGTRSYQLPWSTWESALSYVPPRTSQSSSPMLDHVKLLSDVFLVYAGYSVGNRVAEEPRFSDPGLQFISSDTNPAIDKTTNCSGGGVGTFNGDISGFTVQTSNWESDFSNCADGDRHINGKVTRTIRYPSVFLEFANLTRQQGAESVSVNGNISTNAGCVRGGFCSSSFTVSNLDIRAINSNTNSSFELTNASYQLVNSSTSLSSTLNGGFLLKSASTQGVKITVSTPTPLSVHALGRGDEIPNGYVFPVEYGEVKITTEDGDELTLFANNGDINTARISKTINGVTTEHTEPWTHWYAWLTPSTLGPSWGR